MPVPLSEGDFRMTVRHAGLKSLAAIAAATLVLAACAGADQSTPSDSQAPAAQTASDGTQTPSEAKADTVQPTPEPATEEAKTTAGQDETESSGQQTQDVTGEVDRTPGTPSDVEFAGLASWINSEPLTLEGLRGNVVLVDFWTYSCINCIRTLPYVKDWYGKYADQGLVVIGMHTPEFSFEMERDNVIEAAKRFGLEYPIAQDNDFVTWRAFDNMYWPSKYLFDRSGVIRYTHIGEGAYEETERMIQQLLAEPDA